MDDHTMVDMEVESDSSDDYSFSRSEVNRRQDAEQIGNRGETQKRLVGEGYVSPTTVHQLAGSTPPRVRPHLHGGTPESYCVSREKRRAQQGQFSQTLPVSPVIDALGISKVKGKPVRGVGAVRGTIHKYQTQQI